MWVDFAASCFRCQTCTLAVRIRRTVAHNYYRAASHTTFFSPPPWYSGGAVVPRCVQFSEQVKTNGVVAGALPMPTNHGHTPWKMAKFIFRNFLTILVDTVAPNFIFWAHCAQNRNFLTILVDTVAPNFIFWAHCAQNRNFLTILVDTVVPKLILAFFLSHCEKVTKCAKLKLFDNFRWHRGQNWNFLTI